MGTDLNKRIDLTCPVCEKGFHQTLGWLIKHTEVICPHCDSSYKVAIADPETLEAEGISTTPKGASFFTKVAGVTHRNNNRTSRQSLIARCSVGEELILEREPDNAVDPNAIKVCRRSGEQLGYIPAHVAASGLARDLDRGDTPKCRITDLTGGGKLTRGVNIEIGEWPEDSHPSGTAIPSDSPANYGWVIAVVLIAVAVLLGFLLARH